VCRQCSEQTAAFWAKVRGEVRHAYGERCQCCGECGPLFLSLDHVENNGAAHRRELKIPGGHSFYLWLRRNGFPKKGYQMLCMNCNFGKKMNNGVCPHKTDPEGHPLPERR